jgi:hypothetical protein
MLSCLESLNLEGSGLGFGPSSHLSGISLVALVKSLAHPGQTARTQDTRSDSQLPFLRGLVHVFWEPWGQWLHFLPGRSEVSRSDCSCLWEEQGLEWECSVCKSQHCKVTWEPSGVGEGSQKELPVDCLAGTGEPQIAAA